MRLLVDSNALPWYALGDPRLSATAQTAIRDGSNEILVSPASFWEIAIKISIGKLTLHQPFADFMDACLTSYGFQLLPIEPPHVVRVSALPFPSKHKDPFDRIIVSQALVESVPVVSADSAIDVYGVHRVW